MNLIKNKLWPQKKYRAQVEPKFLFIITPPNSGSTALIKLLNTSANIMILTKNGEGQWLIPGLCNKNRWKSDKFIDYESIKSVWLHQYQHEKKSAENIEWVAQYG